MNEHDFNQLFASLNQAVDILHRNRTPDPRFIAAYDTLKQARAMLEKTIAQPGGAAVPFGLELAAA